MKRKIIWLDSRKALDRTLTGGKAANLARLVSLGFPVPKGFVIPPEIELKGSRSPGTLLGSGRRRLDGPLAVRSSLVGEDGTNHSFAGQLETVLGVEGEKPLLTAVAQVRSSVFHPRIRRYAEQHDLLELRSSSRPSRSPGGVADIFRMAVLVQEMVPALAAGVAFSADPLTGRRTVIIEAVPRHGDALLQGRIEPDRFIIDPRGELALEERKTLSRQDLPSGIIKALGDTVLQVAARFGTPQDVEWAWDGKRMYLLQARPITSLAGQSVYSKKLLGDMIPGPIKPLVWSTNVLGMVEGVFGDVFTRLIGKNDHDFRRILRRIRSRAYVDTTFVGRLLAEVGLPGNLFEAVGREEKVPVRVGLNRTLLARAPRFFIFCLRHARLEKKLSSGLREHDRALDAFRKAELASMPASRLFDRADELLMLHRKLQGSIMFASMSLGIRTRLLKRYVARHAAEVDPSHLLLGRRGLKSTAPNRELSALAAEAASLDQEQVSLFLTGDTEAIGQGLTGCAAGTAIIAGVERFLGRYGFLSANGTNFGEPSWEEEPGPVWKALGRMIRSGQPNQIDNTAVREGARKAVLDRLGPFRRIHFARRLASVARYLELREGISSLMTEDTYELRRLFLGIGRRLVEQGRTDDAEDVFLLHAEELRRALGGDGDTGELRALIEERRAELDRDRDAELPETIVGEGIPEAATVTESGPLLTGMGVSTGVVRGTARVVRELDDAPASLTRGDILIVPFSDVGWTPLFATVGGIVAECGGQLSHTAIVAREYGLPAVVGVRGVMREIRDGQVITVDGGKGHIHLAQAAPPGESA